VEKLSRSCIPHGANKVACVQLPIHSGELEVASLLEAPLAVLQTLSVMEPAVADVGRVTDLTAQHGAAAVQGILGLGLLCELEGRGLDGQNCEREKKESK